MRHQRSRPPHRRRLSLATPLAVALLLAAGALVSPAAAPAAEPDPWATLTEVRRSLVEAGPTEAEFTQTYVPAGFSSGETESGRMSLELPECLRWDYREPYAKSFLLCGERAHYWNPDDGSGRRYTVDRREEPGLDLVLLGLEELRGRYDASARRVGGGGIEVTLASRRPTTELASATLVVDPEADRLTAVAYEDAEGNRTRFELSGYRAIAADRGEALFRPPAGIDWRTD